MKTMIGVTGVAVGVMLISASIANFSEFDLQFYLLFGIGCLSLLVGLLIFATTSTQVKEDQPPQDTPPEESAQEGEASVSSVAPRWRTAFAVGIPLSLIGAIAVWWLFEPMYEATAWLRISAITPYIAFDSRETDTKESMDRFVKTQIELIRSPLVLGPVLSRSEVAHMNQMRDIEDETEPTKWLASQIEVRHVGDSELCRVTYKSRQPEDAAKVVNAIMTAYFELLNTDEARRARSIIELLKEEKHRRVTEVRRLREHVRDLSKQATGIDPFAPPTTESPHILPVAEIQAKIVAAKVEQAVLSAQVKAFEKLSSGHPVYVSESEITKAVEADPGLEKLRASVTAKEAEYSEAIARSAQAENDPASQKLVAAVRRDKYNIERLRDRLQRQMADELRRSAEIEREREVLTLRFSLEQQQIIEKMLQQEYETELAKAKTYSGETVELEIARRELKRAEDVLERIANRIEQLATEQRAPSRVVLLKEAEIPTVPIEIFPYRNMAIVGLTGFFLPFAVVAIWKIVARLKSSR